MSLSAYLTSIADAIRAKKGTTDPINAQDFASEIASIEGGGGVSFITSDGLEFNCITSWEECLDSNGDVLLDENGAPLMSGKYGSFTVTVKDRLQDINELPAIEDVNNILVYKTPVKYTDAVYLVKSKPREKTINVILYQVTETEVTAVDFRGAKMSGVVVIAGHTTVTSPVAVTETSITIYADMDGEWVYAGSEWLPFTDGIPSEFDASTYKGVTYDAPTTSSTPGLYLHFDEQYAPRKVTVTNVSDQYAAEGGSITVIYVDSLSDVTSPVVSPDELNPILYVYDGGAVTYNGATSGAMYDEWCAPTLDSFFKGKVSEPPTKDSADGVYFVRSVTPVFFGIPTTNADIFQNIEGTWKQLGHRRVVYASKFPSPGETGVSGGGSSKKVEVIICDGEDVLTLGMIFSQRFRMSSTIILVDDHTAVTSPEASSDSTLNAYVDGTGVWAYLDESWVNVLETLGEEGIHYFGVHTSMPDVGLAEKWAFTFVSEQTNGSIWTVQGGMCADITVMLMLPTSWTVVSDHNEVTSPEAFDMTTMSGPVYVDNTDVWVYVPDNGGWNGLVRGIMGMPEDYFAFAILTEPPTADSPTGFYFVPVELSTEDGTVDPNFVPYDEDLIYKVTTKEGETNLYRVYDIGNGTIKVQDERKYNAQFNGTLDFIFVEDHTAIEDPIISKELNSTTYYVDGNEIWYFANPGGWICKCSSYSIVSEPPTVESAIGYYLVKATESVGIGVADPDVELWRFKNNAWESVDTTVDNLETQVTDLETRVSETEASDNFVKYTELTGSADGIELSKATDTSITSMAIHKSVTSIGPSAFEYCYDLTSVVIPDSVTSIGSHAFDDCNSLTSVVIPDSVTSIGNYVFSWCTSLTSVVIPDRVTSIGKGAFINCSSLTSVVIPDSVTTIGEDAFYSCGSLTSVVIGDSVTSIGSHAFSFCDSLASVKIPNSVKMIDSSAFAYCSSLASVEIPDSVTWIGDDAFSKCTSLASVEIPDSVTTIGSYAFWNCDSLTSVVIGDSVTTIGDGAFDDCNSLTSVVIPDSVTTIGKKAFRACSSLTSVVIGDSVTTIGDKAFYNCDSLTSITFTGTMEQWNAITFGTNWNYNTGNYTIHCTDGDIAKES